MIAHIVNLLKVKTLCIMETVSPDILELQNTERHYLKLAVIFDT